MRPVLSWIDKITEDDQNDHGCCVYDLAYKPDGSELLVAADAKVLIYDGSDGTLLQSLKGHKDLVYAVAWAHNGEKFASGSADKSVIIWTEQHEGTLKYSHSEPIQCLSFNPISCVLLSCSLNDYAHWSVSEKNVQKQRVTGRITACAWNKKGDMFAIALFDGSFLLRAFESLDSFNYSADNTLRVERPGGEPIWAIQFTYMHVCNGIHMGIGIYRMEEERKRKTEEGVKECLVVTSWDRTISYFDCDGNKIILRDKKEDIQLDYDPTCINFFNDNQFLVIGGNDKQVRLYTKMGTFLGVVAQMDTWIWSVKTKADTNTIVVGCVDGTLACYQLMFSTVHGLYAHMYAYRQDMTDVVIQHLTRHVSTRLKCEDLVRKVAIYKNKLAIQLANKVLIYKQVTGDREGENLEYRLIERINESFECSLLVVCTQHIVVCQERQLQCYDHRGIKQREWQLMSMIRYIKVIGGPPGGEALLVGMKSGHVCKIFVDNPFPVVVLELPSAVRCLDISLDRKYIAIVDEHNTAQVYDVESKNAIFQEVKCSSVAFNSQLGNVMCYCGSGTLHIRAESMPAFQQRMQFDGFVVGFTANKVYCLHMYAMSAVEVPFSTQLYQYMEKRNFEMAYKVACLGVTEEDWRVFAAEALHNLHLDEALKAFSRVRDYRAMQLVADIRAMMNNKEDTVLINAKILAYKKRFEQVAELYKNHGYEHEAMQLFTDLRMFDHAQALMSSTSGERQKILMRKRAHWAKDSNEPKLAANMFISSGDYEKALNLIIEHNWMDLALVVLKKLDRTNKESLLRLADFLASRKEYGLASKVYIQLNEMKKLLKMHISAQHWSDAFALAERYEGLGEYTHLEYGRWLSERDRFEEAHDAFHKAGADKEATAVLSSLTQNAVTECRFMDAALRYLEEGRQLAERTKKEDNSRLVTLTQQSIAKAEVYYAYDALYSYHHQPFTSDSLETLLNKARFVSFYPERLPNISQAIVYFHMASIGQCMGAFKLARHALQTLQSLHVTPKMQRLIDVATLNIRALKVADDADLGQKCYVCGLTTSLDGGTRCIHCTIPFVYCMATFDNLPLAEFTIHQSLSTEEALSLIGTESPLSSHSLIPFPVHSHHKSLQVLSRDDLLRLSPSSVVVIPGIGLVPCRFFYNTMSTVSVTVCPNCNHIFHSDDFECSSIVNGGCPLCRFSLVNRMSKE